MLRYYQLIILESTAFSIVGARIICVANLYQNELREASSWQEAVEKSKGYNHVSLIHALASQFRENLIIRKNALDNTSWSIRKCHLILGWKLSCGNIDSPRIADFGGGNGYMLDWIKSAQAGGGHQITLYSNQMKLLKLIQRSEMI